MSKEDVMAKITREWLEAELNKCSRAITSSGGCRGFRIAGDDWSGCSCDCPTCADARTGYPAMLQWAREALDVMDKLDAARVAAVDRANNHLGDLSDLQERLEVTLRRAEGWEHDALINAQNAAFHEERERRLREALETAPMPGVSPLSGSEILAGDLHAICRSTASVYADWWEQRRNPALAAAPEARA